MCKLGLVKVWWIRKLIRKVVPKSVPLDLKVEDAEVKVTRKTWEGVSTEVLRLVSETSTRYDAIAKDGKKYHLHKGDLGISYDLEILEYKKKKKEESLPLACELDEDDFEKRLEESKKRCRKFAIDNPVRSRFGVIKDLVKGKV